MALLLNEVCADYDNPDSNIRIKSIQDIASFSLSEEDISQVVIPRLVQYLDDSEEVLLIIITQILKLKYLVQDQQYIYSLFLPLEILSDIIEDEVRIAAVQAIVDLLKYYELTGNYLIILINKLIKTKSLYASHSAVELIEDFLPVVSASLQEELVKLMLSIFKTSPIALRHQISSSVLKICLQFAHCKALRCLVAYFLEDSEDFVRVAGVNLLLLLQIDIKRYVWILDDKSWKVRCYLAQNISGLLEEGNLKEITQFFVKYLTDVEPEVKNAAYSSLENFCGKISGEELETVLEAVKLIEDSLDFISPVLASYVIKLCSVVGVKYSNLYLLEIIKKLLNGEICEIEFCIIQEVKSLSVAFSLNFIISFVYPVLLKLLDHKNWKIRMKAISQLPQIGRDLGLEFFMQYLHSQLMKGFNDLVHAVRLETIRSLAGVTDIFTITWTQQYILPDIFERSNNESYITRITAVNSLLGIYSKLNYDQCGEEVLEVISRLSRDKISNVRICVAKLCESLTIYDIPMSMREQLDKSIEGLQSDEDQDVRLIVSGL